MFWSITWNIMKRHLICAEIGVSRLKIRWTILPLQRSGLQLWTFYILSMEYSFLVRLKNHSVQSHVELSNKIDIYRLARDGPNIITDPFVFGKLQLIACQNFLILENLKLCVWWWCLFESTSVCGPQFNNRNLSLTKGNRPSYKSSITCNNNSKLSAGLSEKDQMIKTVTTAMW